MANLNITNAQTLATVLDLINGLARTDKGVAAIRQALAQNDIKVSDQAFLEKLEHMCEVASVSKGKGGMTDAQVENLELAQALANKLVSKGEKALLARQAVGMVQGITTTQKASAVLRQGVKSGLFKDVREPNQSAIVYELTSE